MSNIIILVMLPTEGTVKGENQNIKHQRIVLPRVLVVQPNEREHYEVSST